MEMGLGGMSDPMGSAIETHQAQFLLWLVWQQWHRARWGNPNSQAAQTGKRAKSELQLSGAERLAGMKDLHAD